ncbi:MAG TPA: thermostable hemolysin [Burkholderiales bacterium]|nr:thermostable hemolysin [Burkholderiales bacterium]
MAMSLASRNHDDDTKAPCAYAVRNAGYRLEWMGPRHHGRASLQCFIADVFFKLYGAEVRHFSDTLVGCRGKDGQWLAALGFSLAGEGAVFLEQYLDAPLESEIASRTNTNVSRHQIVEVGNLAAIHAGAARELIICMTRYLHGQGLSWVAFTATRSLLNSFARLSLNPIVLANADPRRLPDAGKSWGAYYDTKPQVMFGDIRSGHAQLAE